MGKQWKQWLTLFLGLHKTIKSEQNKTTHSDLWITPPFIREHKFAQTKPRLTFVNLTGKRGAGGTIKLKANLKDVSS